MGGAIPLLPIHMDRDSFTF